MERVEPIWHRFAFACRALKHFCMKKLLIASAIRQIVCECYYEFKDFNFFDLQQSFNGNKKIFVRNAFIFVTCLIVYWLITCCVYSPNCLAWDMCSSIHFYIFIFFWIQHWVNPMRWKAINLRRNIQLINSSENFTANLSHSRVVEEISLNIN